MKSKEKAPEKEKVNVASDEIDMAPDVKPSASSSSSSSSSSSESLVVFKDEVKVPTGKRPAGAEKKKKKEKSAEQNSYEDEQNVICLVSPVKANSLSKVAQEVEAKKFLKDQAKTIAKETQQTEDSIELGKVVAEKMIQEHHVLMTDPPGGRSAHYLANIPLRYLE